MKILHVITSLSNGGAERALTNIVLNDDLNANTVLSLQRGGRYEEVLGKNGIEVVTLGLHKPFLAIVKLVKFLKNHSNLLSL